VCTRGCRRSTASSHRGAAAPGPVRQPAEIPLISCTAREPGLLRPIRHFDPCRHSRPESFRGRTPSRCRLGPKSSRHWGTEHAALGSRSLLHPFKGFVKWNPADDRSVECTIQWQDSLHRGGTCVDAFVTRLS